ncbi:MAG: OOP family OmpA-OmpF porin [Myxococcota bacterium]
MTAWMLIATVWAQTSPDLAVAPEVDAHMFQLSIDSDAAFFTNDAGTVLDRPLVRGRAGVHYAQNPRLGIYDPNVGFDSLQPLDAIMQFEVNQVLHVDRFRIGVDLPLWMEGWANGQAMNPVLSEIGIDGRVTILDPDERSIGLGIGVRTGIPTLMNDRTLPGAARRRYLHPDVVVEKRYGPLTALVDVGYRWLSKEATPGVVWGDNATARFAVGLDMNEYDSHVSAELGTGVLFRNPQVTPGGVRGGRVWAEMVVGGWQRISGPVFVEAFLGASPTDALAAPAVRAYLGIAAHPERPGAKDRDDDGLVDLVDGCPLSAEDFDEYEDADGCPEPDNDLDGVLDTDDSCPLEPEDIDTFQDDDGCPDPDNDRDGLLDEADECPLEPEDFDNYLDEDGCPDPSARVVIEVVDPRGNFRSAAQVSIRGNGLAFDGLSGDLFDLHDASYTVRASEDEWRPSQATVEINVEEEARRFVTISLEPIDRTGRVRVRVVTPEGAPVDGATVSVVDTDISVESEGGNARLTDVPEGEAIVEVRASGYGVASLPVTVVYRRTQTIDIQLEPAKAVLIGGRIEIRDSVFFETASATIREISHSLLDDVALIITDNPRAEIVQVEGHTDSRGSASYNKRLSERRAASVRQYLVDSGLNADRLVSVGFGEELPIDPREVPEAWDRNRRVDFYILQWEGEAVDVDAEREKVRQEAMNAGAEEFAPDEETP